MGRWLGIDHGTKRIGVAAGSTDEGIATPLTAIPARPGEKVIEHICRLAREYDTNGIVVGWPINMNGTEGPQGKLARAMARQLAAAGDLDVRLWDERLSSFAADEAMAGKLTRKQKKERRDAVAAAEMLRDFLTSGGEESARRADETESD